MLVEIVHGVDLLSTIGALLDQVAGASNPLNDEIERENVVAGVAHLCFSDDGSWFQVRVPAHAVKFSNTLSVLLHCFGFLRDWD